MIGKLLLLVFALVCVVAMIQATPYFYRSYRYRPVYNYRVYGGDCESKSIIIYVETFLKTAKLFDSFTYTRSFFCIKLYVIIRHFQTDQLHSDVTLSIRKEH